MESGNSINVLISSFACGPYWGSEVGMGWNWIINLSNHCNLIIITEKGFQKDIEAEVPKLNLANNPTFYYIDIGNKGRELFWKQGSFLFYNYYNKWQRKAYGLSNALISKHDIQIIHQLNLIGFREPGYLWKLAGQIPFVWGPVGGFNQVPLNYIATFSLKNKLFYYSKHLIQHLQVHYHSRVKKALKAANIVFAESTTTKSILKKVYNIESILMNETGADFQDFYQHKLFCDNNSINLLWVGKIQGLKGLPIALQTLKNLKENNIPAKLTIVGDGPDEKACRKLVDRLEINEMVLFTGKIPNMEVKTLMKKFDLLFFTSLKEGTPHVVLEALSNGLPVLCHDACGHGDVVNDSCGVKVPLKSYHQSIQSFTAHIEYLYNSKCKLYDFSKNAKDTVEQCSWEKKAKQVVATYKKLLIK
ncbi:glycosyltransferase [Ginsengibacter hankyongi]|uniref:Glycosyltransferase n=1 Tax=Ginsengibacter hankyongi TaxID=2607284 RepID=A0A5J5IGK8_9BACT|nr:glycosyltransferase [Ginsengibacter hankyongi]KAA9039294.1 glycosyltransferase [Ginsengibacter hankyongi]